MSCWNRANNSLKCIITQCRPYDISFVLPLCRKGLGSRSPPMRSRRPSYWEAHQPLPVLCIPRCIQRRLNYSSWWLAFQQYIVDGWTKVEGNNLNWLRHNQQHLRSETYQGLYDHLHTANPDADIGRVIILPSSFPGSPRNMYQNFQDAMSIVRVHGKPDIFLTFTANPKCQEITESLLPGQTANDRPDIVSRVFYLKLHELKEDLLKRNVLGRIIAHVYTIEFQKRGLLHAHMLLFFKNEDKPRTPQDINALVSAQIPDPQAQPVLYEKVKRHMIHGPCGQLNPACPCMKNGHCSKGFPKPLANETKFSVDGYPHYERHHGHNVFVRNHTLDDQNDVPYNPYLLAKYDCHINVEVCTTVKSVKYIFKYIHKGHDCASVELRSGAINHDEIQDYLNARYVGPHEAIFRLLELRLHEMSHTIQRLAVHPPCTRMSTTMKVKKNKLFTVTQTPH